eukprot:scpid73415/ scgid11425/ Heterogeneous nuclear ribonucleoprotein K
MSEKRPSGADADTDYPAAKRERLESGASRFGGAEISLRCLIPAEDAGAVIGKGGSVIKHMRTLASSVLLPDSNGAPDRVLTVIAPSNEQILDVLKCVLPQLGQSARADPNMSATFRPTLRVLLIQDQVGGIIGRGGERINQLRQSTNTTIKVNPDPMPNSTERLAAVTGQDEDIIHCITRIMEFIAENPSNQAHPLLFDPAVSYQDQGWTGRGGRGGSRGGRGGRGGSGAGRGVGIGRGGSSMGRGGAGAARPTFTPAQAFSPLGGTAPAPTAGAPWQTGPVNPLPGAPYGAPQQVAGMDHTIVTEQVTIPDQLAGAIIGPRGSRVLKVREQSQCQIKIEEAKPDRSDRVITIVGTHPNVQYAQELLQENVRNYSNYGGAPQ